LSTSFEKEALIQSGRRHYSEMLSPEAPALGTLSALFDDACRANGGAWRATACAWPA
jgi:hypothetical protein